MKNAQNIRFHTSGFSPAFIFFVADEANVYAPESKVVAMKTKQNMPTKGKIHFPSIIPEILLETITAGLSFVQISMIGISPFTSR